MKKVDMDTYKRREIFEVFKDRDIPYLATTSNVDVTNLKPYIRTPKNTVPFPS